MELYYKNKNVFLAGHTGSKGSWLSEWLLGLGAMIPAVLARHVPNWWFNLIGNDSMIWLKKTTSRLPAFGPGMLWEAGIGLTIASIQVASELCQRGSRFLFGIPVPLAHGSMIGVYPGLTEELIVYMSRVFGAFMKDHD